MPDYTIVFGTADSGRAYRPDGAQDVPGTAGDSGGLDGGHEDGASSAVPKACVEPAIVDFGRVGANETETRTFRLRSCGSVALSLREVALADDGNGWFRLDGVAPQVPALLDPLDEVVVAVSCSPDGSGAAAGRVDVLTDDPDLEEGRGYVRLLCSGKAAPRCAVKADPAQVDFGRLAAGVTVERRFDVVNIGGAPCTVLSVSGPASGPFSLAGLTDALGVPAETPFEIAPSGRAGVRVRFEVPVDKTCPAETFVVENDSENAPRLEVPLKGCGGEEPLCALDVNPGGTVLNFGNVFKGSSKTLGMFFENTGTSPCMITGAQFGGGTGPWYSLADGTSLPAEVMPGETLKAEFRCAPAGIGPAPSKIGIPDLIGQNLVVVSTTDPDQPRAAGYCPADGWCRRLWCVGVTGKLDVLPSPAHFGRVTLGCASAEMPIRLYNNGDAPITLHGIEVVPAATPEVFAVAAPVQIPVTIAPKSTATLGATYTPSKEAIETASLRIATDAPNAIAGFVDVPMTGEGTAESTVRDTFRQSDTPLVDVLWCVDNSASMAVHQLSLAGNIPQFIEYASTLGTDYQMGVVTAEINEAERGRTGDMIYPGVLFQRAGYPRIVTNSSSAPRTDPYLPEGIDPAEAFAANAMPGECCAGEQESCMEAVKMALSDPLASDEKANQGFLRRYAKLAVVMLSNEDDQSPGTVAYYADFLRDLKGRRNPDLLSVSVIAGLSGEGTPKDPPEPALCDEESQPAQRYLDLFKTVGNGAAFSICYSEWGGIMRKLGLGALHAVVEYFLSRTADPASVVVMVNGAPVMADPVDGYTFDPATNSIVFGRGAVPPPGASIDVLYRAVCY
jgi:hypothetical protein